MRNPMKYLFPFLLVLLFAACNTVDLQKKAEAKKYSDYLEKVFDPVLDEVNDFIQFNVPLVKQIVNGAVSQSNVQQYNQRLAKIKTLVSLSQKAIAAAPEFDKEIQYKTACVHYLEVCEDVSANEFLRMQEALSDTAQQNEDSWVDYGAQLLSAWKKVLDAENHLKAEAKAFNKKYKIKPAKDYKTNPDEFKASYEQVSDAYQEARRNNSAH
jgi:hypothetical protein